MLCTCPTAMLCTCPTAMLCTCPIAMLCTCPTAMPCTTCSTANALQMPCTLPRLRCHGKLRMPADAPLPTANGTALLRHCESSSTATANGPLRLACLACLGRVPLDLAAAARYCTGRAGVLLVPWCTEPGQLQWEPSPSGRSARSGKGLALADSRTLTRNSPRHLSVLVIEVPWGTSQIMGSPGHGMEERLETAAMASAGRHEEDAAVPQWPSRCCCVKSTRWPSRPEPPHVTPSPMVRSVPGFAAREPSEWALISRPKAGIVQAAFCPDRAHD
ncbi:predicted protein [Verticillium alfalfae VaMs.102]|uniref:Predicted protein n=1 Tax=Verticillium alfalfae (strain VaMs.102 / ATCC MYA-4576 / FGSC 10136) TaxID=526221 RepID=C9SSK1_VERA1|nr:predicted protein [Verticillium alfalfae VaMs.102]EEY21766.1 predicted protein [Verticillium alfalfae VaMs.102]